MMLLLFFTRAALSTCGAQKAISYQSVVWKVRASWLLAWTAVKMKSFEDYTIAAQRRSSVANLNFLHELKRDKRCNQALA